MWNLKYDTNEPTYKAETDSPTQRTNIVAKKGGGEVMEVGVWAQQMQTITYRMEWIDNKIYYMAQGTTFNILG